MARKKTDYGEYEDDIEGIGPEAYASGALGGATTGAAVGTAVAPGIGTAVGAGIGAGVGLLGAALQNKQYKEAQLRDLQLEEELGNVDHLATYMESIGAAANASAYNQAAQAEQAGARAGLSGAAQADFTMQAKRNASGALFGATAQAVLPASQADIAEKNRIVQETFDRQELLDQGVDNKLLGAFGGLAGVATQFAATQDKNLQNPEGLTDLYGSEDSATSKSTSRGSINDYFGSTKQANELEALQAGYNDYQLQTETGSFAAFNNPNAIYVEDLVAKGYDPYASATPYGSTPIGAGAPPGALIPPSALTEEEM